MGCSWFFGDPVGHAVFAQTVKIGQMAVNDPFTELLRLQVKPGRGLHGQIRDGAALSAHKMVVGGQIRVESVRPAAEA